MKKNPGRKIRRKEQRKNMIEFRKSQKSLKDKSGLKPHFNAIKANEIKEAKQNEAFDKKETMDMIFKQETKLGKEMLKEQEARLKHRQKWQKRLGIA